MLLAVKPFCHVTQLRCMMEPRGVKVLMESNNLHLQQDTSLDQHGF